MAYEAWRDDGTHPVRHPLLATPVIAALALATLRGLRDGTLLAPEPVATIAAAA